MAQTMMALGDYRFSVDTAAYQSWQRSIAYRWPQQERIGREPASQFVGPGTDSITLEGTIYPAYKGGLGQLDAMRDMAGAGKPLLLVNGLGRIHHKWCITQIDEGQSTFMQAGIARKVTFTMTLQKYGEDQ